MMQTTMSFIISAVSGVALGSAPAGDRLVEGFVWDSRQVTNGCAFLCIAGQRVDGHDYVFDAIAQGATICILEKDPSPQVIKAADDAGCVLVRVASSIRSLEDLAIAYRDTLASLVVGITGSSGKTTTKDMVESVLSTRFKTTATKGNHNNDLGVPFTVLSADADCEALVVEMGMNGFGQIRALCAVAKPEFGIITNVGEAHIEFLGSRENIARAKGELVEALRGNDACAILCADDPYTPLIMSECVFEDLATVSYGLADGSDVRADNLSFSPEGNARFTLTLPDGSAADIALAIPGRHNVSNALAAAALGWRLGIDVSSIKEGLETFSPTAMRLEVLHCDKGYTIINDAYNANPGSMRAAFSTLDEMEAGKRRIAVLGDMGELGKLAGELHRHVGEEAAASTVDLLVCIGDLALEIAAGARAAGMNPNAVFECSSSSQALDYLTSILLPDDIVLVKASRSMGLESVVKGLVS